MENEPKLWENEDIDETLFTKTIEEDGKIRKKK